MTLLLSRLQPSQPSGCARSVLVVSVIFTIITIQVSAYNPGALHRAALHGSEAGVQRLLHQMAPIDELGEDGSTALIAAVKSGRRRIAEMLLAAGASTEGMKPNGLGALDHAKATGNSRLIRAVQECEEADHRARAETRRLKNNNDTILTYAARSGRKLILRRLLRLHPALLDMQDEHGGTALMAAASAGDAEIVHLLLEYGADVHKRDRRGRKAWSVCTISSPGVKWRLWWLTYPLGASAFCAAVVVLVLASLAQGSWNPAPLRSVLLSQLASVPAFALLFHYVYVMHALLEWRYRLARAISRSADRASGSLMPTLSAAACGAAVALPLVLLFQLSYQSTVGWACWGWRSMRALRSVLAADLAVLWPLWLLAVVSATHALSALCADWSRVTPECQLPHSAWALHLLRVAVLISATVHLPLFTLGAMRLAMPRAAVWSVLAPAASRRERLLSACDSALSTYERGVRAIMSRVSLHVRFDANLGGRSQNTTEALDTYHRAIAAVQALPLEEWAEVHTLPPKEVRARLQRRRVAAVGVVEAEELRALLAPHLQSSCAMCLEEYVAADPLRVLPCSHSFHVECIDRWALSQAAPEQGRVPSCPLCRQALAS